MTTETKPSYSPGLAGIVAGETEICWVDPNAGLMYRGYDIHEMAQKANFEEVAYLLLKGELPSADELAAFSKALAAERTLPEPVLKMLRLMPKNTHPMDMLRTGVSMLAPFDPDLNDHSHDANVRKAIRLLARVSTLVSDGWRISQGQQPLEDKPDLTHAGNFFYKLTGGVPQDWQIRMLDTIYILYADHEYNASTFAARVTASTLADMYAAVTSACGTLKGPLHGGANEESMKMLDEIGSKDRIPAYIEQIKAGHGKLMGFGHRIYKNYDPRARIIKWAADQVFQVTGRNPKLDIALELERIVLEDEYFIKRKLYPNVDFYSGIIYQAMGFDPAMFTVLFAIPRTVGWLAQWQEMIMDPEQKIARPRQIYIGHNVRDFVSIEKR